MVPEDIVHFGSSNSNGIERYWKEIHERMETFFKRQLLELLERGHYTPEDDNDIYIHPHCSKRSIYFHRVVEKLKTQISKNTLMPDGIPKLIYINPEECGMVDQGWEVSLDELEAAAGVSGVLAVEQDYLPVDFAIRCRTIGPEPENIASKYAARFYLTLRREIR